MKNKILLFRRILKSLFMGFLGTLSVIISVIFYDRITLGYWFLPQLNELVSALFIFTLYLGVNYFFLYYFVKSLK